MSVPFNLVQLQKKMSFPDKEKRQKCWDSRDRYWECLDKNGDLNEKCIDIRKLYEAECPSQWVSQRFELYFTFLVY